MYSNLEACVVRMQQSQILHNSAYMDGNTRKPVFGGLRTTQAQTSLGLPADWSAPLLFAYCKVSYPGLIQAKCQFSS